MYIDGVIEYQTDVVFAVLFLLISLVAFYLLFLNVSSKTSSSAIQVRLFMYTDHLLSLNICYFVFIVSYYVYNRINMAYILCI